MRGEVIRIRTPGLWRASAAVNGLRELAQVPVNLDVRSLIRFQRKRRKRSVGRIHSGYITLPITPMQAGNR